MSERSSGPSGAEPDPREITELLAVWRSGDDQALERLVPAVYLELRRLADRQLQGERSGHTLQPTALVHEAFLKLRGLRDIQWHDRTHFFAFSSRIMRRILVDHARGKMAAKRGAEIPHVSLLDSDAGGVESTLSAAELIDLDRSLDRLSAEEPRLARLVEVRFFGGLTVEEAAEVLECSPQWQLAAAAVALGARRWSEAESLLASAEAECRSNSQGTLLMETRLQQARLALARGDHPERVRTLAEQLERDAKAGRFGKIARQAGEILRAPRLARG